MYCQACLSTSTRVLDSRPAPQGAVRRRRECENCGERFTTYETYERLDVGATELERLVLEFLRSLDTTEEMTTTYG
jgi:hypothetical protein